jgi:hypothetical protein
MTPTILHVAHCMNCWYVASARTEAAVLAALAAHAVAVDRCVIQPTATAVKVRA